MSLNNEPGGFVKAEYKSGSYVGELIEVRSPQKALIKVLAVLQHPLQGDLHHPYHADAARFFPRKALAFGEIALVPLNVLEPYHGEVPDYAKSLQNALDSHETELRGRGDEWAQLALSALEEVKKEYR